MKLPNCARCGQPRNPDQLHRNICEPCRAHTCTKHNRGTVTCYTYCQCRCQRCAAVWYRTELARGHAASIGRPMRIDATGTQRRIRALFALGWTSQHIADRAGISEPGVWQIAANRRYVNRETAQRIQRAYDALSMRRGPSETTAKRSRQYPPPLAWDDGNGPHGIDNPKATPYGGRDPQLQKVDQVADEVRHLIGSASAERIANRLGYADLESLAKVLRRAGYKTLVADLRAEREVA